MTTAAGGGLPASLVHISGQIRKFVGGQVQAVESPR